MLWLDRRAAAKLSQDTLVIPDRRFRPSLKQLRSGSVSKSAIGEIPKAYPNRSRIVASLCRPSTSVDNQTADNVLTILRLDR